MLLRREAVCLVFGPGEEALVPGVDDSRVLLFSNVYQCSEASSLVTWLMRDS